MKKTLTLAIRSFTIVPFAVLGAFHMTIRRQIINSIIISEAIIASLISMVIIDYPVAGLCSAPDM